ncbi:Protein SYS1 homolog [Eumeta japonica]|uniref:Protein SYS1 homolog n=1 Tax=Eumeta variegata TaxID=151549 RepID=A0A4C1XU66_EUMVA|nr:Protein SYS1 homolog [Eumeta japonica]
MTPLSQELSGLILPYDSYGTHLDEHGTTQDHDLKKMNFQKAEEDFEEVWNNMVIDDHDIIAENFEPNGSAESYIPDLPSSQCLEMHNVRPSCIHTRRSIGKSREILCVVCENDEAEWLDETDVDLQQSTVLTTDLQDAYPVEIHVRDSEGRSVILAFILNALVGAFVLWMVVGRTKLCLDFSCTYHCIHLLVCWIYNGIFPMTFSWWTLNVACAAITCVTAEFLCLRTELQAIPLSNIGAKVDL